MYIHCTDMQIMMLKLRGHPPILMKKQDGGNETQLSSQLSKVSYMYMYMYMYTYTSPCHPSTGDEAWNWPIYMHMYMYVLQNGLC